MFNFWKKKYLEEKIKAEVLSHFSLQFNELVRLISNLEINGRHDSQSMREIRGRLKILEELISSEKTDQFDED